MQVNIALSLIEISALLLTILYIGVEYTLGYNKISEEKAKELAEYSYIVLFSAVCLILTMFFSVIYVRLNTDSLIIAASSAFLIISFIGIIFAMYKAINAERVTVININRDKS